MKFGLLIKNVLMFISTGFRLALALELGRVYAATFTVDRTFGAPDASFGSVACTTTGTSHTRRALIQEANAFAGASTINFSIADGVQPINFGLIFPSIIGLLTIDGTIQSCYSGAPFIKRNGPPMINEIER
jgi:hypothetical protein